MRLLFAFFVMILPGLSLAQVRYVTLEGTYSTYSMSQLKQFQTDYANQLPVQGKIVTAFPAYGGFGTTVALVESELGHEYGLSYYYNSTGGRVDYKDYSGSIRNDQLLIGHSMGLFANIQLGSSGRFRLSMPLNASIVINSMKMTESGTLGTSSSSETYDLRSTNFGFRPSLAVRWTRSGFFLQGSIGYELQVTGDLHLKDDKDAIMVDYDSQPMNVQWDGLRTSLGIGFMLQRKKQD